MLYKVLLISVSVTIQIQATEQFFPLVLFIMLYKGGSYFLVFGKNPKVWALTKDE